MIIISDTSALSALAETGLLEILPEVVGRVTITESLRRECLDAGAPVALRNWIAGAPAWLSMVPDPDSLHEATSTLGAGEASAISPAWTQRHISLLILDEKRGRKVARSLDLKMSGLLALVANAAIAGLIDFEDSLQRLEAVNFRISDRLIQEARQTIARASNQGGK